MTMRTQHANTAPIPSLSTMGYLTMVLALAPGIAAFSGMERSLQKPLAAAGLKHAYGPGTDSTYITRRRNKGFDTRLYYISEASNEFVEPPARNAIQKQGKGPVWWNSIFGKREQSSAADEYLEFLDRRYNRILHDENEQEDKGFPVLNWLYQGANGNDSTAQKHHEENALYVLGVANLASKKLLQKHHYPRDTHFEEQKASTTINRKVLDATDAEIVDTSAAPKSVTSSTLLFRVAERLAERREQLIRAQMKHFRLAVVFLMKSLVTGPVKALQKLYNMGGGKKSMALTFTALAALSFLLRPLLKVAARESMSP